MREECFAKAMGWHHDDQVEKTGRWGGCDTPFYAALNSKPPVYIGGRVGTTGDNMRGWRKTRHYVVTVIRAGCLAEEVGSARTVKRAKVIAEKFLKKEGQMP